MSILLPNNRYEKLARYNMLVKQGSITIKQAKQLYCDYLRRPHYERQKIQKTI